MSESAPLRIGILGAARITERSLVAPARSGGAPPRRGGAPPPPPPPHAPPGVF